MTEAEALDFSRESFHLVKFCGWWRATGVANFIQYDVFGLGFSGQGSAGQICDHGLTPAPIMWRMRDGQSRLAHRHGACGLRLFDPPPQSERLMPGEPVG